GMGGRRHVGKRGDVRRAQRLDVLRPGLEVVDHQPDMVQALVVETDAGLVHAELQKRDVEIAIGHENAAWARRLVGLARIETVACDLAKAEGLFVELRGPERMIAGDCDMSNLSHATSPTVM